MRVGVVPILQDESVGGGVTFEATILQALGELAPESPHEFVVLHERGRRGRDAVRDLFHGGPVQIVEYRAPGVIERGFQLLRRDLPFLSRRGRARTSLERAARRVNVQMLWFVSGGPMPQTDLPYITVVWDLEHRAKPWFPEFSAAGEWDLREQGYRRFLQRATYVITGTDAGASELQTFYQVPAARIHKLPHPTPAFALNAPDVDPGAVLSRYGLARGYLFYPAQFWPHKNHANLLAAVRLLVDEGRSPVLVLSGSDRGNRKHIESIVSGLGLQNHVRILGFVPQEDLPSLYRGAVALTYLSLSGPENLPPLEAFALGCPVIGSRIPGSDEQLGDAAVLVQPDDPRDIASGISGVLADSDLRSQLVERGLLRCRRATGGDYVRGVFGFLDAFEPVRRTWP